MKPKRKPKIEGRPRPWWWVKLPGIRGWIQCETWDDAADVVTRWYASAPSLWWPP